MAKAEKTAKINRTKIYTGAPEELGCVFKVLETGKTVECRLWRMFMPELPELVLVDSENKPLSQKAEKAAREEHQAAFDAAKQAAIAFVESARAASPGGSFVKSAVDGINADVGDTMNGAAAKNDPELDVQATGIDYWRNMLAGTVRRGGVVSDPRERAFNNTLAQRLETLLNENVSTATKLAKTDRAGSLARLAEKKGVTVEAETASIEAAVTAILG